MVPPKVSVIPRHPLGEVELLKSIVGNGFRQLLDLRPNRHRRELLRLRTDGILVVAIAVPPAPGYLMRRQQETQVFGVDIQLRALPGNTGIHAGVLVRNAEAAAFVVHEAVKGDFPDRTEIPLHLRRVLNLQQMLGTGVKMGFPRKAVEALVKRVVLPVTPFQRLPIQVRHIPKRPPREEIALHEANKALDLAFGVRMPGFTELRLEADSAHERLVLPVPDRLAAQVPVIHDALHVVRQDIFRDAHELKSVDHANEQTFLLGIGEKLDEHAAAVMAAEDKTGDSVFIPARIQNRHEAPVHLVSFSRLRLIPLPAAALRLHQMPLCRNQVLVCGDVDLNGGGPARIADRLEPLQTHHGVCDAALEQRVEGPGEPSSPRRGDTLPVFPCGRNSKRFSFSRRRRCRDTPVRRSSSARLTFSRSYASPASAFISASAWVILSISCLLYRSCIALPFPGPFMAPVYRYEDHWLKLPDRILVVFTRRTLVEIARR